VTRRQRKQTPPLSPPRPVQGGLSFSDSTDSDHRGAIVSGDRYTDGVPTVDSLGSSGGLASGRQVPGGWGRLGPMDAWSDSDRNLELASRLMRRKELRPLAKDVLRAALRTAPQSERADRLLQNAVALRLFAAPHQVKLAAAKRARREDSKSLKRMPWLDSRTAECVSRTIRRQVLHALSIAGRTGLGRGRRRRLGALSAFSCRG